MSTPVRLLVLMLLVCAAIAPATADLMEAPSLQGYTGLLLVPSAETLQMAHWNAGAFTTEISDGDTLLGAAVGLPRNLEVGVLRVDPDNGSGETLLHAKYRLEPLLVGGAAVAVGMFDITDEIDSNVYAVFSKQLAPTAAIGAQHLLDPRVHIGLGSGGRLDGLFAGVSAVTLNKLTLMAEYDSDDINFGARVAIAPKLQLHAGWLGNDSDVAVGLSFSNAY